MAANSDAPTDAPAPLNGALATGDRGLPASLPSYEVIQRSIEPLGVKRVAADLGLSPSMIYKWCQRPDDAGGEAGSGARNPLDRVAALLGVTGDRRVLDWLCGRQGGFFVENIDAMDGESATAFVQETQSMINHFSALLAELTNSMNDDGRIDQDEAREIRGRWEELKSCVERVVVACELGRFDTPPEPESQADPQAAPSADA